MKTDNDKLSGYFFTDKTVREDKSLSDISKLVFGDLAYFYFLGEGKCRATNTFFAKKYSKSEGTISNAISSLVKRGYIHRYLDEYKNRTIFVNRTAFANNSDESKKSLPTVSDKTIDESLVPPDATAPLTRETQKKMDEYFQKRYPNLYNYRNHGAAS